MLSDLHRTGLIIQAAVDLLRADSIANAEVWRDRPQIAHDESDPFVSAIVVRTGSEDVARELSENTSTKLDIFLNMEIECISVGAPSALPGTADTASVNVANLRYWITRSLNGDSISATINLGLAYVIDVIELGASELSIEEKSLQSLASQTMFWAVHYRRSRINPGA